MNTNETQEIEIPPEWDVTVQAAERRGYRAGVEATVNVGIKAIFPDGDYHTDAAELLRQAVNRFKRKAFKLLVKQEEKK